MVIKQQTFPCNSKFLAFSASASNFEVSKVRRSNTCFFITSFCGQFLQLFSFNLIFFQLFLQSQICYSLAIFWSPAPWNAKSWQLKKKNCSATSMQRKMKTCNSFRFTILDILTPAAAPSNLSINILDCKKCQFRRRNLAGEITHSNALKCKCGQPLWQGPSDTYLKNMYSD